MSSAAVVIGALRVKYLKYSVNKYVLFETLLKQFLLCSQLLWFMDVVSRTVFSSGEIWRFTL